MPDQTEPISFSPRHWDLKQRDSLLSGWYVKCGRIQELRSYGLAVFCYVNQEKGKSRKLRRIEWVCKMRDTEGASWVLTLSVPGSRFYSHLQDSPHLSSTRHTFIIWIIFSFLPKIVLSCLQLHATQESCYMALWMLSSHWGQAWVLFFWDLSKRCCQIPYDWMNEHHAPGMAFSTTSLCPDLEKPFYFLSPCQS